MTRASFLLSGLMALMALPAVAEDSWAILPDQATCLMDHLEDYRGAESEPVVIFLKVCPEVDRMAALQALQQNSGAQPSVTVAPDGTPLDEVIVYTQAELACLAALDLDMTGSPVLLPQTPCDP